MDRPYAEDIATGSAARATIRIAGRPRQGQRETYLILEEPEDPVLMHFKGKQLPHFKRNCPNCTETQLPRPMWYIGSLMILGQRGELVILELTQKCFESLSAAARKIGVPGMLTGVDLFGEKIESVAVYRGLLVDIVRADFPSSPRTLRCEVRRQTDVEWPYHTREELARIWGVPIRPRIYREKQA